MQEIYVIRDPSGREVAVATLESAAWKRCMVKWRGDYFWEDVQEWKDKGYTCHRLPVYNPETQVVISREDYAELAGGIKQAIETQDERYGYIEPQYDREGWEDFLNAGNNPLVPIEDTTNE